MPEPVFETTDLGDDGIEGSNDMQAGVQNTRLSGIKLGIAMALCGVVGGVLGTYAFNPEARKSVNEAASAIVEKFETGK